MHKKIILLVLALFICVGVVACTDESDEYTDNNYVTTEERNESNESTEDGTGTNKILKFFGYNKVIKEETIKTKVKIIDKDYKESYTTMIFTGKVCIPVSHPAEYNVKYEYKGIENSIDDEDFYNKVNENEEVVVNLHVKYYEDDTISFNIEL